MHQSTQGMRTIVLGLLLGGSALNATAAAPTMGGYQLDTKLRIVHFDRDFEPGSRDYEQTALAFEANFRTPQYFDKVGLAISPYFVKDLASNGRVAEDILPVNNGENTSYAKFGQVYLNITPTSNSQIKLGWQKHKSMFLNSTSSRAVPNTFRGVTASFKPIQGLQLHGSLYDLWIRRARSDSEGFATDNSAEGDIDFVAILGAKYQFDQYTLEGEYLESKDYLRKFGLKASFTPQIDSSLGKLKFSAGVFTSEDAGDLFVTGAESGDLDDEDAAGAVAGTTRSGNDGFGGYLDAQWMKDKLTLGLTLAGIDEIWIEDNFTGDHGTNPFPTSAKTQDLTNSGEKLVGLRAIYDWGNYVQGLKTAFKVVYGFDAENSVSSALGTGDEHYYQLQVDYKPPYVKGASLRVLYQDYSGDETGSVDGIKADNDQLRIWLDYVIKFR